MRNKRCAQCSHKIKVRFDDKFCSSGCSAVYEGLENKEPEIVDASVDLDDYIPAKRQKLLEDFRSFRVNR